MVVWVELVVFVFVDFVLVFLLVALVFNCVYYCYFVGLGL